MSEALSAALRPPSAAPAPTVAAARRVSRGPRPLFVAALGAALLLGGIALWLGLGSRGDRSAALALRSDAEAAHALAISVLKQLEGRTGADAIAALEDARRRVTYTEQEQADGERELAAGSYNAGRAAVRARARRLHARVSGPGRSLAARSRGGRARGGSSPRAGRARRGREPGARLRGGRRRARTPARRRSRGAGPNRPRRPPWPRSSRDARAGLDGHERGRRPQPRPRRGEAREAAGRHAARAARPHRARSARSARPSRPGIAR